MLLRVQVAGQASACPTLCNATVCLMNTKLLSICLLSVLARAAGPAQPPVFNVQSYGASGGAKTPDPAAINRAIDAASGAGGGMVYFPAGRYLSGSIHLKSNV